MLTPIRSELIQILRLIEILSPHSFRFAGEPPLQVAPPMMSLPGTAAAQPLPSDPLVLGLQSVLYHRCYSHSPTEVPARNTALDAQLVTQLSWANKSRERWDPGWQIYQLGAGGQIFVIKGDRQRSAMPGEYIAAEYSNGTLQVGASVVLRISRESRTIQPGFYYMLGEVPSDIWDEHFLIRFYFNCTAQDVAELVAHLTQDLNRFQVPYRMKALTDAGLYTRRDSMVLYCARRYFQIVARIIGNLPLSVLQQLESSVPMFTKRVRAGVGLAEDPGNGESFGMHRCRLTAEGIVDAWRQHYREPEAWLQAVEARFTLNGLKLNHPYLGPGSIECFDLTESGVGTG
jgi:hypothetical protein